MNTTAEVDADSSTLNFHDQIINASMQLQLNTIHTHYHVTWGITAGRVFQRVPLNIVTWPRYLNSLRKENAASASR